MPLYVYISSIIYLQRALLFEPEIKGPDKDSFCTYKMHLFPYPSIPTCVLGAQKNRLVETVLLSTHNICFVCEIRK